MKCLSILYFLLVFCSSTLFAQNDSVIKKGFIPYGLIDAAPVAARNIDFKPPIVLKINSIDAATILAINVNVCYFLNGDTFNISSNKKLISLEIFGNETIGMAITAKGYIWQSLIFNTPVIDTSLTLKFIKIKKGGLIFINKSFLDSVVNDSTAGFNPELFSFIEFLKINPSVKIKILLCAKDNIEIFKKLLTKNFKGRFYFSNCRNIKQPDAEDLTIKILHI